MVFGLGGGGLGDLDVHLLLPVCGEKRVEVSEYSVCSNADDGLCGSVRASWPLGGLDGEGLDVLISRLWGIEHAT